MKNLYHSDIYKFDTPVSSYWEDASSENLNLEKLTKDINSEIVVIGGGYTGLLCAINLIENHNLDVILVEAGKIGWGASSRNAGFNCLPPSKMSFKKDDSRNSDFKDKKKPFGYTNNPKYFGKKSSDGSVDLDKKESTFKGKKKFKNRKRPKNFSFNKFKKKR